ncbi:MAG: hypothetical protein H6980_03050 [Gammaproteobacteria bacterium]|nr:hypothetical protein [Gammaproteobacteria bacterium]
MSALSSRSGKRSLCWMLWFVAGLCLGPAQADPPNVARPAVATETVKTAAFTADTPEPTRFVVRGTRIIDLERDAPLFFKGVGYSPYLPGETPVYGAGPGDDARYAEHLHLLTGLGANYLHVFSRNNPAGFFAELDRTDLLYGQDIWLHSDTDDFLDPEYQRSQLALIRSVIDEAYRSGRPDRLVLFSIGDELQPWAIIQTDRAHPGVSEFVGRHIVVSGRTPTEVAIAKLMDAAIDYELTRYGRRHLYCHTSFTHVGPLADRPDLHVPASSAISPDIGDLICLNIYTYSFGVVTSPPGSVTGSRYQGYLEELAAGADRPILIGQAGLPVTPDGTPPWLSAFGNHDLARAPDVFRAIWQDLRTARGHEKFCGLAFFEFHDEWWKSGQGPTDADRHDGEDSEEWYGLYSSDGGRLHPKGRLPETVRELFTTD